jgi:glutamate carboxypeptidase
MSDHASVLRWVDQQRERMRGLVTEWASINSGSYHVQGLGKLSESLQHHFSGLGCESRRVALPPQQVITARGDFSELPLGAALSFRKHGDASIRVLLGIHIDTVYGPDDPFQAVEQVDDNTLRGPGVADAKGGIAVMLVALEALERSPVADRIGWEVLLNPDEEIGSPGSAPLLAEAAGRNHLGLVFEPAYADGTMVGQRKGSGNFSVVFRGRSAHAGRDFSPGRNAVLAAADFGVRAAGINGSIPDVTLNVARIDGGGPMNVVPDLGICRLNTRVVTAEQQRQVEGELSRIAAEVAGKHEVTVVVNGGFSSHPWVPDEPSLAIMEQVRRCGQELGLEVRFQPSGGASDANKLAAAGLPVVDTMGPRGGNLHSLQEFLLLDSLTEKAKLTALLLMRLASGEIQVPASH